MSLRSFHIFFLVIAILADFGIAAWAFSGNPRAEELRQWGFGIGVFGILLLIYLVRFIIKSRKLPV